MSIPAELKSMSAEDIASPKALYSRIDKEIAELEANKHGNDSAYCKGLKECICGYLEMKRAIGEGRSPEAVLEAYEDGCDPTRVDQRNFGVNRDELLLASQGGGVDVGHHALSGRSFRIRAGDHNQAYEKEITFRKEGVWEYKECVDPEYGACSQRSEVGKWAVVDNCYVAITNDKGKEVRARLESDQLYFQEELFDWSEKYLFSWSTPWPGK